MGVAGEELQAEPGGLLASPDDDALGRRVSSGQVLRAGDLAVQGEGPWAVLGAEQQLLAVYESYAPGLVKPAVVIPASA